VRLRWYSEHIFRSQGGTRSPGAEFNRGERVFDLWDAFEGAQERNGRIAE
jgi:hypothetical protein